MPTKPLLFAYDDSDGARHAIRAAAELFEGAHVLILHVGDEPSAMGVPMAGAGLPVTLPPPEADERSEEVAKAIADQGVQLAAELGFRAEPLVARAAGPTATAREILAVAEEHDAGLIVLGSRGRSGISAVILGSVANAVVHGAKRPTLTVPRHDT